MHTPLAKNIKLKYVDYLFANNEIIFCFQNNIPFVRGHISCNNNIQ